MDSEDDPASIELALAEEEARVARLDDELAEARARLVDLRDKEAIVRGVRPSPSAAPSGVPSRLSVPEKIAFFRGLYAAVARR